MESTVVVEADKENISFETTEQPKQESHVTKEQTLETKKSIEEPKDE
jgi:hypothetical protein